MWTLAQMTLCHFASRAYNHTLFHICREGTSVKIKNNSVAFKRFSTSAWTLELKSINNVRYVFVADYVVFPWHCSVSHVRRRVFSWQGSNPYICVRSQNAFPIGQNGAWRLCWRWSTCCMENCVRWWRYGIGLKCFHVLSFFLVVSSQPELVTLVQFILQLTACGPKPQMYNVFYMKHM